jgi:hypothetical protein
MSGYLSGWPEATTSELDRYYHHHFGGSPTPNPPHSFCAEGQCPYPRLPEPEPEAQPEPEAA